LANSVLLPQLGISEESAIITVWHVQKGDAVQHGDKLFSLETGKSTFDVESEYTGTVLALLAEEGDEVAVKAAVCVIGTAGEDAGAIIDRPQNMENIRDSIRSSEPPQGDGGRLITAPARDVSGVSPRARNLAEKLDADPARAAPTGPYGRVIERDIRALADTGDDGRPMAAPTAYTDQPLSNMRKIIAENMMASLRNTAQLTHTASFDASNILACRKQFKNDPELSGVTLTDMVLYAVTRTLPAFPALNAWLTDNVLRVFKDVSLACAVDTERGLMVPVIFGASGMTLPEISKELKTLAEGCRNGTADPKLLSGGSFTVSNLGQFGIESFTPILNPPQTGILGVNTITTRVREDGSVYPCMTLSLTYDHRALDGAPASRFLQNLCKTLEGFSLWHTT
jgi:pyruvate dehydrogenase E2 component (dihydrolipoamide acetyltransferase)